ncbi:hypothetical protein HRG_014987 [Hirsutella rhossiliensis]
MPALSVLNSTSEPRARPDRSTTPAPSSPLSTGEDTIVCAPPGHPDCESDDDMPDTDTPEPPLDNSHMTLAEKAGLIKKWADNKQKHVRKKRDKNSHVYWYMQREAIDRSFYSEYRDGPKIFQEFRWTCIECLQNPSTLRKVFQVLESNRRGVTSGMGDHLKTHSITKESHHARINGYGRAIGGGDYTEADAWSGRPRQRARLTAKESIRRWFVKHRQPFSVVETPAFQEMFLAHNTTYFVERREKLKIELEYNCDTISFTLDIWTAPNRVPIFAIIAHWITPEFEEREEVIEFIELKGSHTGKQLAEIVEKTLEELRLKPKLLAITGDNAANNGTLCQSLYDSLKTKFDDKVSPIGRPRMRFHGKKSWIRCLAHITSLICDGVLQDLKAGTAKEAKKMLDKWDEENKSNNYTIPGDSSRNPGLESKTSNACPTHYRKPTYDVDTRWNSTYDMIDQFLELEAEYTEFVDTHPQVKCLLPLSGEIVALYQLRKVLKPFKEHTLKVSEVMPSISQSLDIYWDLEALLDDVVEGVGEFSDLDVSIRNAFSKGKTKHATYMKKLDDQMMLFAAHILDPRYKTHQLEMMIPDQYSEIIAKVKKYFRTEWPELATLDATNSSMSQSRPAERPQGVSIAQWRAIQMKKAKEAEAGAAIPISELERWFATPRTEFDESIAKSPDFLRKWWKEHKDEWPLLATAARDILSVSGSEVDVERLFSGCRDEFGIRRHALKADTARVLTLLRSSYTQEDKIDQALIKAAMEYDILPFANSIIWRPDHIPGKLVDGMNIPSLYVYMLICVQTRIFLLNPLLLRKFPPRLRLPTNLLPQTSCPQADESAISTPPRYNGGFGGLRLYECVAVYNGGFERAVPTYFEDSAKLLKIFMGSLQTIHEWPELARTQLESRKWSLKILNQDPKNSIHLIHPSFKIFKKFTFIYHPYTAPYGWNTHVTPEFDKYCTDNAIVVLQMPAHSSHLLQPLDVGRFSPLKRYMGGRKRTSCLYTSRPADKHSPPSNIRSGFMATGLSPFNLTRVDRNGNHDARQQLVEEEQARRQREEELCVLRQHSSELTCLFVSWNQLPSVRVASPPVVQGSRASLGFLRPLALALGLLCLVPFGLLCDSASGSGYGITQVQVSNTDSVGFQEGLAPPPGLITVTKNQATCCSVPSTVNFPASRYRLIVPAPTLLGFAFGDTSGVSALQRGYTGFPLVIRANVMREHQFTTSIQSAYQPPSITNTTSFNFDKSRFKIDLQAVERLAQRKMILYRTVNSQSV